MDYKGPRSGCPKGKCSLTSSEAKKCGKGDKCVCGHPFRLHSLKPNRVDTPPTAQPQKPTMSHKATQTTAANAQQCSEQDLRSPPASPSKVHNESSTSNKSPNQFHGNMKFANIVVENCDNWRIGNSYIGSEAPLHHRSTHDGCNSSSGIPTEETRRGGGKEGGESFEEARPTISPKESGPSVQTLEMPGAIASPSEPLSLPNSQGEEASDVFKFQRKRLRM